MPPSGEQGFKHPYLGKWQTKIDNFCILLDFCSVPESNGNSESAGYAHLLNYSGMPCRFASVIWLKSVLVPPELLKRGKYEVNTQFVINLFFQNL